MKTKQVSRILTMALSTAALAVYGCGGGGSSSAPAATTVTTSAQASSAGATSASTATVSANMGQTLSTVASPGAPKFKSALAGKDPRFAKFNQALATAMKAPRSRVAEIRKAQSFNAGLYDVTRKYDCKTMQETTTAIDNIMSMSITSNDLTTFVASITFTNCRIDTARLNGTMSETYTTNTQTSTTSFTTKAGNGNNIIDTSGDFVADFYPDSTSTISYATLSMDLTETGSENNSTTPPSYSFSANGVMKYVEGINSYAISLTNVSFAYSESATTGKITTTANGTFGESWTESGLSKSTSITFESFVTTELAGTVSGTSGYSYVDYTADGKVTVANTGFCTDGNGTWVIATTTAIRERTDTGEIIAGKLTINTATVVEFQTDGSVIVTLNGTPTTKTKAEFDAIESSCAIADLEDNKAL